MGKDEKGGFLSGEHGGIKIYHHSTSSLVRITKTYTEEVEQGVYDDVTEEEWYDYGSIFDLYKAIQEAKENNLSWIFKKK